MVFWKRKDKFEEILREEEKAAAKKKSKVPSAKKKQMDSSLFAMELKLLALDALEAGLSATEVGDAARPLCRRRQVRTVMTHSEETAI